MQQLEKIYKKIRVRSNDKLVIVNGDWDLFGIYALNHIQHASDLSERYIEL